MPIEFHDRLDKEHFSGRLIPAVWLNSDGEVLPEYRDAVAERRRHIGVQRATMKDTIDACMARRPLLP